MDQGMDQRAVVQIKKRVCRWEHITVYNTMFSVEDVWGFTVSQLTSICCLAPDKCPSKRFFCSVCRSVKDDL